MFAQPVTVTFQDGTAKEVVLTQWSIGQFGQYAQSKRWNVDTSNPGLMGLVMLRFQAFAELHRDPKTTKVSFDVWDMTVEDVSPVEDELTDVVPTGAAPSGD